MTVPKFKNNYFCYLHELEKLGARLEKQKIRKLLNTETMINGSSHIIYKFVLCVNHGWIKFFKSYCCKSQGSLRKMLDHCN